MTFQCIDPFRLPFVRFSISFALGFCSHSTPSFAFYHHTLRLPPHTRAHVVHLETFSKIYLVIVAAQPPSPLPSPSPSTCLACSVLVLNPPPLASAKQAIIESLSPSLFPCAFTTNPLHSLQYLSCAFLLIQDRGLRPQTIPELT